MTARLLTSSSCPTESIDFTVPTPSSARSGVTLEGLRTSTIDAAPNRELFIGKPRVHDLRYCTELITHAITQLTVLSTYVLAIWGLTANIGLTNAFPWSTGPLSNWLMWFAFALLLNLFAAKVQRTENSLIRNWTPSIHLRSVTGREPGAAGLPGENQKLNAQSAIISSPRKLAKNTLDHSGGSDLEPPWWQLFSRAFFPVLIILLAVPSSVSARASDSAELLSVDPPALAFARYIAFLNQRSAFTESGAIAVDINASLPQLGKRASLSAIRQTGASERSEYQVLHIEGDSMVKVDVIARYLSAQAEAEALPLSSTLVTPVNYKFDYVGSTHRMGVFVYVFQISPRKKRVGLIQGLLLVDPVTGVAMHQTGRFVKSPSVLVRRINITCDTSLRNGLPYIRVTHATVYTRLPVGRAELTITERPATVDNGEALSQLMGKSGKP